METRAMNYIPLKIRDINASEIQIQSDAWRYLVNTWPCLYGLLFHIPNGGSRGSIEGKQFQAAGLTPGEPDLCLVWHRACTMIEVKTWDKQFEPLLGRSKEQIKIHAIHEADGTPVYMAYSAQQIVDIVLKETGLTINDSPLTFTPIN